MLCSSFLSGGVTKFEYHEIPSSLFVLKWAFPKLLNWPLCWPELWTQPYMQLLLVHLKINTPLTYYSEKKGRWYSGDFPRSGGNLAKFGIQTFESRLSSTSQWVLSTSWTWPRNTKQLIFFGLETRHWLINENHRLVDIVNQENSSQIAPIDLSTSIIDSSMLSVRKRAPLR